MIGIVAVLVMVGLAVVLWRLVASQQPHRRDEMSTLAKPVRKPRRAPALPPDDDPEFLAELSRRTRRDDENS